MRSSNEYKLNNPLPYIFIAFILGSYIYKIYEYDDDKLLAVIFACSFIYLVYKYKSAEMAVVTVTFLIVMIGINLIYYDFKPNYIEEVRISYSKESFIIGNIENRKIYLEVEDSNIKVGDKLLVEGYFDKDINPIYGTIGVYKVNTYEVLEDDFITKLNILRESLFNNIKEQIGQRKASIITSLSFGYKDYLDYQDNEHMSEFGVSHAMAVSGLHMAIVYGLLKKVLGYKIALIISVFYVLFTGMSSSTIRAYIMILIMTLAPVVKRNYNTITALSLAGIVLLIFKPYDIFSLGFGLSFLATLGIILLNKDINKKLYRLPDKLRGVISISISAQVFTFPIIAIAFNEFSLNFLLGNIVILPLLNILVVLGNLLLITFKIEILFNYLVYLCYLIIRIMDRLVDILWTIKLDKIYLSEEIGYFYCILLMTIYFYYKGFKRVLYVPIVALVFISISIYDFIPSIKYYDEGALLLSYKGDRAIVQTANLLDKIKLKELTKADVVHYEEEIIVINEDIKLEKSGRNYILKAYDYEYLLKVNYEKSTNDYDIIDFKSGELREVMLLKDTIILK